MIDNARQIKITDVGFGGMLFQIIPLISVDMDANQIKAELQLANNKLDDKINKWNSQFTKKQKKKNAIQRIQDVINIIHTHGEKIKTTIVMTDAFENEVKNLYKLRVLTTIFGMNVIIDDGLKEDFIII